MKHAQLLFVDLENIHSFDLHTLRDNVRVYVFVGNQQKKIPFDLAASAQKRGESLEWVQISGQGRNALDFHIAFYLGELNQTAPSDVGFMLLSKDTGYDPLVEHISRLGRNCKRINSLKELAGNPQESIEDPRTQRIIANLSKIQKAKLPRTRNTLSKHIQTVLGGKMASEEALSIIDNLFMMRKLSETSGRLTYNL
jgi:hypothetical protein